MFKRIQLDPTYFCTAPGLAFETCLKMTGVKLELFKDIDMVLMDEKGIRGGISQAVQRYASANNKYIQNYNSKAPSTFLMYVDVNNLYGWPMSKKLPIDSFEWINDLKEFTSEFIRNYDENEATGCLLEVDIEYPKNLHESHRDWPFLPIKKDKLLTTLEDKENYVVHIFALNHGLELKKVHRAISFRQGVWLKRYINKNTELRKNAKNDFEKDFFKLMNNAVYYIQANLFIYFLMFVFCIEPILDTFSFDTLWLCFFLLLTSYYNNSLLFLLWFLYFINNTQ